MTTRERVDQKVPLNQDENLGQRLKDAREYMSLTQEAVAEKLNVPRASISEMERGRRKVSAQELKLLAALYRRPIAYFLGQEEEFIPDPTDQALFRAAKDLTLQDKEQVLKFAQFLKSAGPAPLSKPLPEE